MLAPADGYTVLEHIDNAISAYAAGDIRENPAKDWVRCMTQITFSQIYIRSDEDRFTDWESFSKYAKEHPGDVTMANLGKVGSMELVVMEQLQEALGPEDQADRLRQAGRALRRADRRAMWTFCSSSRAMCATSSMLGR